MNTKHEEAKISIAFPHVTDNYNEVVEKMKNDENVKVVYKVYGDDESGSIEVHVDSEPTEGHVLYALMFSDRNLEDKAVDYYSQITNYFSAIDEDLKVDEENNYNEYDIRAEEVNGKWFNGNFNYWLFEKGE